MGENSKHLLYFAPEIPALSATFVYNEIIASRNLGVKVSAVSVHRPSAYANEEVLKSIGNVTILYKLSIAAKLKHTAKSLLKSPIGVCKGAALLVKDVLSLGLFNKTSVGQCYRFFHASILASIIKEIGVEHIHVHFAHVPTDIAMYASAIADVPFSVTSHANDIFERGYLLQQKIDRSKFFNTISQFNKRYLLEKANPEKTNNIKVIYCGVDTNRFFPCHSSKVKNLPKFTFGFLARLVEKKGCSVLLDAVAILAQKHTGFEVHIAGDGPLREVLTAQASSLGINDYVKFVGVVENTEVPDWLNSLDSFVLPCVVDSNGDMDGIPVSLMEAMACGLPVISSEISGISELIEHNVTGVLITQGNEEELCKQMKRLIDNPDLCEDISLKGLNRIHDVFSISATTEKLIELTETKPHE